MNPCIYGGMLIIALYVVTFEHLTKKKARKLNINLSEYSFHLNTIRAIAIVGLLPLVYFAIISSGVKS